MRGKGDVKGERKAVGWITREPGAPAVGTEAAARPPGPGPAALTGLLGGAVASAGGARLEFGVSGSLVHPMGSLHGGITLYACDLVARAAAGTEFGPWHTTSIHAAYPRPVPEGSLVRFTARVMHRGRSFAVTQVTASSGGREAQRDRRRHRSHPARA